jgi:hypothetical protein
VSGGNARFRASFTPKAIQFFNNNKENKNKKKNKNENKQKM